MAKYIGSDSKVHKTNIIGLLPSSDYGSEYVFASFIPGMKYDKLFAGWNEWNDENTMRTIYVQYNMNEQSIPIALGMTVQFDDGKDHNVTLTQSELDYLTACLLLHMREN